MNTNRPLISFDKNSGLIKQITYKAIGQREEGKAIPFEDERLKLDDIINKQFELQTYLNGEAGVVLKSKSKKSTFRVGKYAILGGILFPVILRSTTDSGYPEFYEYFFGENSNTLRDIYLATIGAIGGRLIQSKFVPEADLVKKTEVLLSVVSVENESLLQIQHKLSDKLKGKPSSQTSEEFMRLNQAIAEYEPMWDLNTLSEYH